MPASVHVLSEEQRPLKERESEARLQRNEDRSALVDAIRRGDPPKEIEKLLEWYERSALSASDVSLRRARRAEKVLRAVLGTDLTDAQYAAGLSVFFGHDGERRRNPGGMSDNERALVEQYRTMDADARLMMRTLFARLAADDGGTCAMTVSQEDAKWSAGPWTAI